MTTTIATLPRSIYIEPTSRCNEFCQQCPRTLLSREEDRDLIRYLKDRGTYVLFNSNGIALTQKRGQQLIDAGLDEYRLSMDASTSATYAHVRGVDAFDKIWRNISAFVKMQQAQDAKKPAVSLWFTAMRENLPELPTLIDRAYEHGIREVYMQRLVYFDKGLASSQQSLFHRASVEELQLIRQCEKSCRERGMIFKAAGAATPLESIERDFGNRPWSGCRRPYTLTYITSSGNVLSCCFAPFGHRSAKEYREERVLGNVFEEPIEHIWHGERYNAFRQAFESDHPVRHCSQCGLNWSY